MQKSLEKSQTTVHTHTDTHETRKNFTNKSFNSIRINNIWIVTVIAQGESKEKSFNLKCAYIFFRVCICVCQMTQRHIIIFKLLILADIVCRTSVCKAKILKKECNHSWGAHVRNCQSLFCVLGYVYSRVSRRKISKIMHVFPINICCLFIYCVKDSAPVHR